jgi:hypothetical protein
MSKTARHFWSTTRRLTLFDRTQSPGSWPRAWTAVLLLLAGCPQAANSLTGSLGEVAPLDFTTVAVRASDTALVVEYQKVPQGGTADIIFKLVINPVNLQLNQGLSIDLAELLADGSSRANCIRAVTNDPRRVFPPIKHGELILDSDVNIGKTASGHFNLLFGEGGDLGEGRTVEGTFSAEVGDAAPGGNP